MKNNIICPFCNKEFSYKMLIRKQEEEIIEFIKRNVLVSIADISRGLNVPRSSLIYYLNRLENKELIKKTRIYEGETGRPTIYSLKCKKKN